MSDKLSKEQIKELLPHREPMLLIDELINIKKLQSATAIVRVKKDSFLKFSYLFPLLPPLFLVPKNTSRGSCGAP